MQLGMIGLGRMGGNMTTRLLQGGHQLVAFDPNPEAVKTAAASGARPATSLADLGSQLQAPRAVWVMVPSGDPTEKTVQTLAGLLKQLELLRAQVQALEADKAAAGKAGK